MGEDEVLSYSQKNTTMWEFLKMGLYSLLGMMGYDSAYQNMFYVVLTVYHRGRGIEIDMESLRAVKADPVNKTRPNIEKYKNLPKVESPPFPVFTTYGDSDIYGPSREETMLRYPTSKFREIESCGHLPWIHDPKSFGAILDEFYSIENSLSSITQ